jgi:hypothetical protein
VGIQERIAVIHTAKAAARAAAEEQGLRKGGLARIHMGQQTDAAGMLFLPFFHRVHLLFP